MTPGNAHGIVRWFAGCGERYIRANLGHVDAQLLAVDKQYGLKLFLFMWAFERAGAPRAYRIAGVKAVSIPKSSQAELPGLFRKFCGVKLNERANPALDPRIVNFDVPRIVQMVGDGALDKAFQELELRGIGPKIRAFFLRDLVTLLKAEPKLRSNPEAYLWCQPIDVWVREAAKELPRTVEERGPRTATTPPLSRPDLAAARRVVNLSLAAEVSPLKVNQGIWYFAANAVADVGRLRELVRSGDHRNLQAELALMEGFLPAQPVLG